MKAFLLRILRPAAFGLLLVVLLHVESLQARQVELTPTSITLSYEDSRFSGKMTVTAEISADKKSAGPVLTSLVVTNGGKTFRFPVEGLTEAGPVDLRSMHPETMDVGDGAVCVEFVLYPLPRTETVKSKAPSVVFIFLNEKAKTTYSVFPKFLNSTKLCSPITTIASLGIAQLVRPFTLSPS